MVSLSNRSNNYVVNSIFCVINQHSDLNFNFCKFSCRVNKYFLLIKSFDKSFITGDKQNQTTAKQESDLLIMSIIY